MACCSVNITFHISQKTALYKCHVTVLHVVTDEPLSSTGFYRWYPGQPNNAGGSATLPGEDCGAMHTNGGLNDYGCNVKVPFICEQELW
jgi:hypothetical protein